MRTGSLRAPTARAVAALLVCSVIGWQRPAAAEEPSGLQAALVIEQALMQAIARSEKSVVSIARVRRSDTPRDGRSDLLNQLEQPFATANPIDPTDPDFVPNEFAAGVVVDPSGLILTNCHVIDRESDHYVTTSERKVFHTTVYAADPRSDLAVLRVIDAVAASDFVPIKFGDASRLKKGQIVIALGNPYAIARDGQVSASWGIVSNLSRKEARFRPTEELSLNQLGTLIQTDAKLNLGTSGGALVNLQGEMIGLTTAVAAVAGYEESAGFAIPVDAAFLRILETLKKGREVEYGFLGVLPHNLAAKDVREGKQGAKIDIVTEGTPAMRAGLKSGDVVTHVNGRPLHEADQLRLEIGRLPAASTAILTVERNSNDVLRTEAMPVLLSKYGMHTSFRSRLIATNRDPAWRGMRVDYPTAVLHPLLGDSSVPSVAVSEVADDSPAFRAGVRREQLITHVDTTPVETPEDFRRAVADANGPVTLKVVIALGEYHKLVIEPK
jgi:serine protease Do